MQPKRKMEPRLTKTAYLQFLKCPQEFWLQHHQPLLIPEEITLEHEHLRQQGYAVEQLVKTLARFKSDDECTIDFQRTIQTTELTARLDVVVTDRASHEVQIFEIKSSGSVKEEHYDDVAFQKVAAERSGLKVSKTYVITLNTEYVRQGDINVEQLFTIHDVSDTVDARLVKTEDQIKRAFEYLDSVPAPSLAEYCAEKKLNCRFIKLHFPRLPEYTVFDISYLKHDKRRDLLNAGIVDIKDVPTDFKLSDKQRKQVDAARNDSIIIEHEKIAAKVSSWQYPLHFLDYETFAYAIPQFDGVKPFQQMCFQYSLHTIDGPGTAPHHKEYLSRGEDCPPRCIAEHLRDAMGARIGTVFVWYEAFEKGRNAEMGEMFPDLKDFFDEVNEKTYDLMQIFSDNLFIHPGFKGKTSIKKVLPVLVPSLRYDELGIGDGLSATIKWFRAVKWTSMGDAERLGIFNDLLEYCELDTVAMVEIFRVLAAL